VLSEFGYSAICSIVARDEGGRRLTDIDPEEPVPDVIEQHQDLIPGPEDDESRGPDDELPLEADPADAADQAREVNIAEDDYR
jgi:hypothetical protein